MEELTEEERALLAAEDAGDVEDDTPEIPAPAEEETPRRRRGRPRKDSAAEEPSQEPAKSEDYPDSTLVQPRQYDGDPWGTLPVQMRG